MLAPGASLLQQLRAMALPAATLVFAVMAHIVRMTRTALAETMSAPFIEMAVLKGLPTSRVVLRHALPNAIAPILNVVGFSLAYCVVGVVVIEAVFVYPGVGQLMVDAVSRHDLPVVQACGLIFGATYVFINLLIDLWILLTNPLIRAPR
jgi:peptide/nickel transport system permease protein